LAVDVVGRREELLGIDGFLGAIPAGGQALLLEGDAGIGKTVLWEEAKRLAREREFRELTSRSSPSETQIAFATVGDAFAPVVEETLPHLPDGLLDDGGRPGRWRLLSPSALSLRFGHLDGCVEPTDGPGTAEALGVR
jgi:hypothetical protein